MRRLILTQSVALLQEDSGIPYKYFDTMAWRVQLFGVYHQPIPLFRSKFQQDLWQAYRTYSVGRLPFNIGYHTVPGQSNLLWAVRRDPQAALPPLPEEPVSGTRPVSPLPPQPVLSPIPSSSDTGGQRKDSLPTLPSPTEVPSGGSE
jgi:hypothetical protein